MRRKLDLSGVKLKLSHWLALTQAQRQELVDWSDRPAELDRFREHLRDLTKEMADGVVKDLPPASSESAAEVVVKEISYESNV